MSTTKRYACCKHCFHTPEKRDHALPCLHPKCALVPEEIPR